MSENNTDSVDLNKMREQALIELGIAQGKIEILTALIKVLSTGNQQNEQEKGKDGKK